MDVENPFLRLRARWLVSWTLAGLLLMSMGLGVIWATVGSDEETSLNLGGIFMYLWLFYWAYRQSEAAGIALADFFKGGKSIGILPLVGLVILLILFSAGVIILMGSILSYLWPAVLDSDLWMPQSTPVSVLNRILDILVLVVLAPVVEEIIFRGILLGRWTTKWNIRAGMLMSGSAFAILHIDFLGAFVFGLCMSVLYLKTRTLISSIVAHALNNGAVVAMGFLPLGTQGKPTIEDYRSSVMEGLVLVAVALPLLVLFIYRNWPGKNDGTPHMAIPAPVRLMPTGYEG